MLRGVEFLISCTWQTSSGFFFFVRIAKNLLGLDGIRRSITIKIQNRFGISNGMPGKMLMKKIVGKKM